MLILLILLFMSTPAAAETVVGQARVVDGDTLVIGETTVRILGIDAPELGQRCVRDGQAWACGEEAAGQLSAIVAQHDVICTGEATDPHGRLLAVCRSDGFELGATMVEYGWALAFRRYSQAYLAHEHRARAANAGIWNSEFEAPDLYRAARATDAERTSNVRTKVDSEAAGKTAQGARQGCLIKGNHSRKGEWIYHLPGMRYYAQTREEEIFCTEAEARAAGYRRSKV